MDGTTIAILGFGLLFILLFTVFAALLNREYWKDVH